MDSRTCALEGIRGNVDLISDSLDNNYSAYINTGKCSEKI